MSDHWTPEQLYEFIGPGGGARPVGHHFMDCPNCLIELDSILLAPATTAEEAILSRPMIPCAWR